MNLVISFGSPAAGHVADDGRVETIPVANREEAAALLRRLRHGWSELDDRGMAFCRNMNGSVTGIARLID